MYYWVLGPILVVGAMFAIDAGIRRRRRRALGEAASRVLREAPSDRREAALIELVRVTPENAIAWYLLGAVQCRAGRIHDAARSYGMAHHRDYTLESAALLTFACLKACEGETCDLIEQIVTTWGEMRKPDLAASEVDRAATASLDDGTIPPELSALGRLTWSVSDDPMREKLQNSVASQNERYAPLRRS